MFNVTRIGVGLGSNGDTEPIWTRHPSWLIAYPAIVIGSTVLTWKVLPVDRTWLKVILTALIGIPAGGWVTWGTYKVIDAR